MRTDDQRHGTNAGYIAGCRQDCCRAASLRYSKRLKYEHSQGKRRTTEAWRAVRRLDALACMGWSRGMVAVEMGVKHKCQLYAIGTHERISLDLFKRIDDAYQRLAMRLPVATTSAQQIAIDKTRNNAQRKNLRPPLAWNDIDDPDERPDTGRQRGNYKAEELVAEWDHFRRSGFSMHSAAQQLGVSVAAIEKALERTAEREAS